MPTAISGVAPPLPKGDSSSPSVNPSEVSRDNLNSDSVNENATDANCAPAGAADNEKNKPFGTSGAANDTKSIYGTAPVSAAPIKREAENGLKSFKDATEKVAVKEEIQGTNVDLDNKTCGSNSGSAIRNKDKNIVNNDCGHIGDNNCCDADNAYDADENGRNSAKDDDTSSSNINSSNSNNNANRNQENPTPMESNDTTTELGSELDLDLLNDIAKDLSPKRPSDEVMETSDVTNVNDIIDGALNGDTITMGANATKNESDDDGNNASSGPATKEEDTPSEAAPIQEASTLATEMHTDQVDERLSVASQPQSVGIADSNFATGPVSTKPTSVQDDAAASPLTPVTMATSAPTHGNTQPAEPNNASASETMQRNPGDVVKIGVESVPTHNLQDPNSTQSKELTSEMTPPKPEKGTEGGVQPGGPHSTEAQTHVPAPGTTLKPPVKGVVATAQLRDPNSTKPQSDVVATGMTPANSASGMEVSNSAPASLPENPNPTISPPSDAEPEKAPAHSANGVGASNSTSAQSTEMPTHPADGMTSTSAQSHPMGQHSTMPQSYQPVPGTAPVYQANGVTMTAAPAQPMDPNWTAPQSHGIAPASSTPGGEQHYQNPENSDPNACQTTVSSDAPPAAMPKPEQAQTPHGMRQYSHYAQPMAGNPPPQAYQATEPAPPGRNRVYAPTKLPPMEYTPLKAPTHPKKPPVIAMGQHNKMTPSQKNILPVNMTPIQWRQQWQHDVAGPPPPQNYYPHHGYYYHRDPHDHSHAYDPYAHHSYPHHPPPHYDHYAPPHHTERTEPRASQSPMVSPSCEKETDALEGITALAAGPPSRKKRKRPPQDIDQNQPLDMLSSASLHHAPYDGLQYTPQPHYSYPPPDGYYHPPMHSPPMHTPQQQHHHPQGEQPAQQTGSTHNQSSLNGLLGAAHVVDSLNLERSNRNRSAHLSRMLNHPNRKNAPKDGKPSQVHKKGRPSKSPTGFAKSIIATSQSRFPNDEIQTQAQLSTQLARQALKYPRIKKKLYLSLALVRVNPRKPFPCPPPGEVIGSKFHWANYPPLDAILRNNMKEYYELSTNKCQSRDQQAFNNRLVQLIMAETERYGWKFDGKVFDEKKIRDRIRCFYKTHIQNAKKRLNTMLKNPRKRANIKALAAHFHLIEDKATLTEEEGKNIGSDDDNSIGFNTSNDFSDDDLHMHNTDLTPLPHNYQPQPQQHHGAPPGGHPHDIAQRMLSLGAVRHETI